VKRVAQPVKRKKKVLSKFKRKRFAPPPRTLPSNVPYLFLYRHYFISYYNIIFILFCNVSSNIAQFKYLLIYHIPCNLHTLTFVHFILLYTTTDCVCVCVSSTPSSPTAVTDFRFRLRNSYLLSFVLLSRYRFGPSSANNARPLAAERSGQDE